MEKNISNLFLFPQIAPAVIHIQSLQDYCVALEAIK
jgi:hypothetical protein